MAQLTGADRTAIKKMTEGTLYLRNNVPCRFTVGMGVGAEVVTEVSPTGVDWDKNLNAPQGKKKNGGLNAIYWGFGPNDMIHYGKLYFRGGGIVELWAEGVKPKNVEIWIRFVDINSRDDFKKAYDLIVSRQPIQDEHPEWPAEIRTAIGERRLVAGMTKPQAFAVVGTPINSETSDESGNKIEIWFPRQDSGTSGGGIYLPGPMGVNMGGLNVKLGATGFPTSLRFVNGKLAVMGEASAKVVLDK